MLTDTGQGLPRQTGLVTQPGPGPGGLALGQQAKVGHVVPPRPPSPSPCLCSPFPARVTRPALLSASWVLTHLSLMPTREGGGSVTLLCQ